MRKHRIHSRDCIYLLYLLLCYNLSAQQDSAFARNNYTRYAFRVPMRDGVKLYTTVFVPKDTSRSYPFLILRTPYSIWPYSDSVMNYLYLPYKNYLESGFIFVYQDVRGRCMSEGTFEDVRPVLEIKDGKSTDETTDSYDTVDWLLKNVKHNNGKAGFWGVSYMGFYANMGAIHAHPAVKAVSPQAPVTNWFIGDDWHHNGAFFLMDAFDFQPFFKTDPNPTPVDLFSHNPPYPTQDGYRFYKDSAEPLYKINSVYFKNTMPFWNKIISHPDYDSFWKARNVLPHLKNIKPAMLVVGGLFDAEDLWGTLESFKAIEKQNPGNDNTLILGTWFHGNWTYGNDGHLGDIPYDSSTTEWFRKNVELPFFNHYLKDSVNLHLPKAILFDIGANKWRTFAQWPSKETISKKIFLHGDGGLSFIPPNEKSSFDEYISDPEHPVPYEAGIGIHRTVTYMIADQRFAAQRPDVLTYETEILKDSICFAGPVSANLIVSTSGTDADFIVKIIDVYPDTPAGYEGFVLPWSTRKKNVAIGGYQMLVRAEIFRGKYRNSYEKPGPFVPGEPTHLKFQIPDVMHTFRPGHSIMIQIQSSWFPLVDLNPQKFVDIYKAKETDFQKATQRVFHEAGNQSYLEIDLLKK